MQQSRAPDKPKTIRNRQWVWAARYGLVFLFMLTFSVFSAEEPTPAADFEYTQAQLVDQNLGMAHDELIMLLVSLAVIVQIIASFQNIRQLPFRSLLLAAFGAVVLSAFCTVAESFVLPEILNYVEHLSFAAASILLAVWCGRVFVFTKGDR
jgi:hypothetical protein